MLKKTKIMVDGIMIIILLLLMCYQRIGAMTHEWLGVMMFVLFFMHQVLNRKWYQAIFKGKYTFLRKLQLITNGLLIVCMFSLLFSGIILSRYVFSFMNINGMRSLARNMHMLASNWSFVLISIHIGLHGSVVAYKLKDKSKTITRFLMIISILIALYGVYALVDRDVLSYMLLQVQFAFYDFEEPVILLIMDYFSIMFLFAVISYNLTKLKNKKGKKNYNKTNR